MLKRSNSLVGLNERDIMTRIRIINAFKLNEEAFLKKYFCDRDTLFNICLPSFKKLFREKADIKFISLYLSNLKKFITLLKNINEENTNNATQKQNINQKDKYLKLLKYVSEHVSYEPFSSKRLVMRYGELGSKFYIILHGVVSILIPIRVNLQMTFFEFSKYIANLLLYKEFELAKIAMRENKHVFRLDLPDMKYIINYFNKNNDEEDDSYIAKNRAPLSILKVIRSEKSIQATRIVHKMSRYFKDNTNNSNTNNLEDKSIEEDKALEAEYVQKIEKFLKLCLPKEKYKLLEEVRTQRPELEKDDGTELSSETYINRLKIYKYNLDNNTNQESPKEKLIKKNQAARRIARSKTSLVNLNKDNMQESHENYLLNNNKNSVYIYEYQEIIQLETGDMFGDTALGSATSKRTATIIAATDCHFGCLNKDIYNYIKFSNDKNRRNNINYICRTRIFKSLKYKTIEEKYINYFAFKNCVKDEDLVKYGEINHNIIIIKSGKFEINIKGGINNIFDLINEYKKNFLQSKEFGLSDNLVRKIMKLNANKNKIQKLLGTNYSRNIDEKINDNIYKLFLINSSSIFGFRENEKKQKDNYISFFEIKCTSSEGEYILLDKKIFYRQMYSTDFKVKEETRIYIKEFTEKTINRLVHVLYSKIYFLLSKNNLRFLKRMKILSGVQETNKNNENEYNSLIDEFKLDYNYMNKYDLTDIECIIDKILNKYNEEDFDNENINNGLYNENEKNSPFKKNTIKLGEEKYNIDNSNSLFKQLRNKNKMNSLKLANFRKYNKLKLKKNSNNNIIFGRKLSNTDKIQKLFNFYSDKKIDKSRDIKYTKIKSSSFSEEKKPSFLSENKIKNRRKFNLILGSNNNNNKSSNINSNNISKSASLGFLGKSSESFMSDINISCNYANFGNACISKLNFNFNNFKRDNSMSSFETSKSNKNFKIDKLIDVRSNPLLGSGEKYRAEIERCLSAKNSNHSSISIFDSTQMSKNSYSERRKQYLLKCVRDIWTRNSPIVLYKRKNKYDKNV